MNLEDEEEGIMAAIDQRKYRIFKQIINWNQVNNLLDETNEAENEGSDEQSEVDDEEAEDEDSYTIIE